MTPLRDPVKNIVYNARDEDIDRVYVNGRLVVDDGRVLAPTRRRSSGLSRPVASACGRA